MFKGLYTLSSHEIPKKSLRPTICAPQVSTTSFFTLDSLTDLDRSYY